MIKDRANEWLNKKLNDKKWYLLILSSEGEFNTPLRIPTFDRIKLVDKKLIIYDGGEGKVYSGYQLYLSKDEELIFRTTYKNYIQVFEPLVMENEGEIKSVVWK